MQIAGNINTLLSQKGYRLHVGCGNHLYEEYVNVDLFDYDPKDTSRDGARYDYKLDLRNLEIISDSSLEEIMFIHGFEHFTKYDTLAILKHWKIKLNEKGVIHLEMPDYTRVKLLSIFPKCLLNRNKKRYNKSIIHDMFYGNQWSELDYETHRYLWTKKELKKELKKMGFYIHYIGNASCFHVPFRDMVVIASKSKTNNINNSKCIGGKRRSFSLTKRFLRNFWGLYLIFKPFEKSK